MTRPLLLFLLPAVAARQLNPLLSFKQPEQIQISWTGRAESMYVTWATLEKTRGSAVEFGESEALGRTAVGTQTKFVHGGSLNRTSYIHRVKLTGLRPTQRYGEVKWSQNARTLGQLQREVQRRRYDVVFHVGDMAYDLHRLNGTVGDQWMRQVEPIAAYVPYMTVPGNHEWAYNFSHYTNRFTMPHYKSRRNNFYSFDLGPVHVIGFSTEFYFFEQFFGHELKSQYLWLSDDLKKANANRGKVPWIVTMGHRPMYCSNANNFDCTRYDSRIRLGLNGTFGLEDLFHEQGVDLAVWAHEHSYERMWPLYNRTVFNSTARPYHNAPAPVHIVNGASGDVEGQCPFLDETPPWTAFRSLDYGFGRLSVPNATHLRWEQTSVRRGGAVLDSFWLTKDHPRPALRRKRAAKGVYVPLDYEGPGLKRWRAESGNRTCHMP